MATQASAITFLSTPGPGLRERPRLRAELLRGPAGADRHRGRVPAHLPQAQGLHRLRIPRPPLRLEDPPPRRGPLPPPARASAPASRSTRRRSCSRPSWAGAWTPRSSAAGSWSSSTRSLGGSEAVNLTQKYQIGVIFCRHDRGVLRPARQAPARAHVLGRAHGRGRLPQARGGRLLARTSTGATRSGRASSAGCSSRCRTSAPTSRRCSATSAAPRCARAGSG